ncbi:hypothetical protein [Nocardiopsis composta]|uniref:LemA family protein n=1 Tax=Nocardiopsis composta TaxID=157465 RepID=A0A7W8QLJ1_9ACTN|nr:hypothetical protein [Nocardiopsis composta]MBB5431973.1 hypothetical protein [Nocardiopsis composta]
MAEWVSAASTLLALLVMVSFYVSWRAGRLDRLHTRVETAHAALRAALNRRSAVVVELAAVGGLEPASAVLLAEAAGTAHRAWADGEDTIGGVPARVRAERELAESDLSRALRVVVERTDLDPGVRAEVDAAAKRVLLARRFYNDAVAQTRQARASRLVRLFRLAGRAGLPEFFEMDDEPPAPPPG